MAGDGCGWLLVRYENGVIENMSLPYMPYSDEAIVIDSACCRLTLRTCDIR